MKNLGRVQARKQPSAAPPRDGIHNGKHTPLRLGGFGVQMLLCVSGKRRICVCDDARPRRRNRDLFSPAHGVGGVGVGEGWLGGVGWGLVFCWVWCWGVGWWGFLLVVLVVLGFFFWFGCFGGVVCWCGCVDCMQRTNKMHVVDEPTLDPAIPSMRRRSLHPTLAPRALSRGGGRGGAGCVGVGVCWGKGGWAKKRHRANSRAHLWPFVKRDTQRGSKEQKPEGGKRHTQSCTTQRKEGQT
jgi:hypothetical protein